MATKTFNDICVEYAHQLGKGLPLTPAEMCNAVIMYLNAQITEMQGITTALQTAVTEAEASATEATNTANELSGKVDTLQTNVTEAESNATEALNKANGVSETVNALPKVPKPTTSDNGKVIGVQSGAYALVEQSGGEAPANMVTTDTPQIITENKGSETNYYTNGSILVGNYSNSDLNAIVNGESPVDQDKNEVIIDPRTVTIADYDNDGLDMEYVEMSIYRPGGADGFNDYDNKSVSYRKFGIYVEKYLDDTNKETDTYYLGFPFKSGMLAVESDIPDLSTPASVEYAQATGATITYGADNPKELVLPIIAGDNVKIAADSSGSHLKISAENVMTTNTYQDNLATKAFRSDTDTTPVLQLINPNNSKITAYELSCIYFKISKSDEFYIYYPQKAGTFALTSDIPDLDNYTGTVHIVQGTAGSGIAVHDTAKASPYTKYGYDKIETYGNSNALQYTLNIPNKNGTIATLDDISNTPSPSKYFTRIIYHSTDEETQYILFSCVTDKDLSSNTDYADVVSLLNKLGATTQDTALSCTGKTVSGGMVVGVYTDGNSIIVFDIDNATEELNMSADIKFISK